MNNEVTCSVGVYTEFWTLPKMDIEGAEVDVLQDCEPALGRVERLFVEYHSFRGQRQQLHYLLDLICRSGFRYHLESQRERQRPLMDDPAKPVMDNRVNIFATRQETETAK